MQFSLIYVNLPKVHLLSMNYRPYSFFEICFALCMPSCDTKAVPGVSATMVFLGYPVRCLLACAFQCLAELCVNLNNMGCVLSYNDLGGDHALPEVGGSAIGFYGLGLRGDLSRFPGSDIHGALPVGFEIHGCQIHGIIAAIRDPIRNFQVKVLLKPFRVFVLMVDCRLFGY